MILFPNNVWKHCNDKKRILYEHSVPIADITIQHIYDNNKTSPNVNKNNISKRRPLKNVSLLQ